MFRRTLTKVNPGFWRLILATAKIRVLTFEDLRALAVVAEYLNLSTAAVVLSCTQPAVSQHVRKLETELGATLIERHRRGVRLTPTGEILAGAATQMVASLSRARSAIADLQDPSRGVVRIATGGTTMTHFMTSTIAAFQATHPQVQLQFQSANSTRRCVESLHRDQVDLAFITITERLSGLDTVVVLESAWTLIEPETSSARRGKLVKARLPLDGHYVAIHPHSASGAELAEQLGPAGIVLPSGTTVDDWDTAIALVELGLGNAVVPALHAYRLAGGRGLQITPIADLRPIGFGWAALDHHRLPAAASAFVSAFREKLQLPTHGHTKVLKGTWS
jgi:DNA-binding transcriptional LysR family regulator